jgi:FtsZ-interacting cell division protein ZipA
MAMTEIALLSIGALIILLVVIHSITRYFKNKRDALIAADIDAQGEENFPSIQDDETEVIYDQPLSKKSEPVSSETSKKSDSEINSFMMISVHAKANEVFSDYSFLQTMGSVGLIYGEHKIFHYDVKTDQGMQRLFSVAQLNKPGTFDIDHVETINCKGLLLFIDLRTCRKQTLALDCMLEVAYQLAEDLDGIMYEGYNTPWQEDTPRALAQQLDSNQKNCKSVLDEIAY